MWIKILIFICAYLDFEAQSLRANLEGRQYVRYRDNINDGILELECSMNEWSVNNEHPYQLPIVGIKSSLILNKENVNILHCDKHCTMSQRSIEKHIVEKWTHSNEFTLDFAHLGWDSAYLKDVTVCPPLDQFLDNLKYFEQLHIKLSLLYFAKISDIAKCKDFYFTNITEIKKLEIKVKRFIEFKDIEPFLGGMANLEEFELKCVDICVIVIPRNLLKGLKKLSSFTFTNCIVRAPLGLAFKDLANFRYLTFNIDIGDLARLNKRNLYEHMNFHDTFLVGQKFFVCVDSSICDFSVDINKNPCPRDCKCSFNRPYMRFEIKCTQAEMGMKIPEIPIPVIGNVSLYFNNNHLTHLPNLTLYGYSNIRELHLANNNLTSISVEQLPPNLTYLDLRNNSLKSFDHKVLEFLSRRSDNITMKMSGNPWKWTCDALSTLEFLANVSNNIHDRKLLRFYKENLELPKADICKFNLLNIFGPLFGVAVLINIFFYMKKTVLMWMYARNLCFNWISRPEPEVDTDLKIDAFLAFSHLDLDLIEEYVEKLEKGPRKYQLCFYQRDWLVGAYIATCILQSVKDSKRIIILLTNNFINSAWGGFEFRTAIKSVSMDKNKRLIVIVYPEVDIDKLDCDLKIYMKYNTYLRRDDPLFWRKLMFAMPHKQIQCGQPALTIGQEIEETQV